MNPYQPPSLAAEAGSASPASVLGGPFTSVLGLLGNALSLYFGNFTRIAAITLTALAHENERAPICSERATRPGLSPILTRASGWNRHLVHDDDASDGRVAAERCRAVALLVARPAGGQIRMYRRSLLAVTVVLFALALIGCGPPWVVVMQTTPNPLVNAPKFSVLPTDFTGLTIGSKPEAVYLSEKDAGQQQSFAADKTGINEEFVAELMKKAREDGIEVVLGTGPGDAPFQIHPSIAWIEPGFYVGVASAPSQVRMKLQITAPDGRVIDEIAMRHATGASLLNPSSGGRFRSDGGGLGNWTAKYLKSRVHPEK